MTCDRAVYGAAARRFFLAGFVVLWALGGTLDPAAARDRPGTPNFPSMVAQSPTQVQLIWHDTTGDGDCPLPTACDPDVTYEVDFTRDNQPFDPFHVAQGGQPPYFSNVLNSLDMYGYFRTTIDQLEPLHHYCFRVWSRYSLNSVRSQLPSAWACADTPAYPPGAPLGLTVAARQGARQAVLTWDAPDQSGARPIEHFDVERQDLRGGGYPIVADGQLPGPNGDQNAGAALSFKYASSALADPSKVQFRVCSVNNGGRTCSDFLPVRIWNPIYSAPASGVDQNYVRSPATSAIERPANDTPSFPPPPASNVTRRTGDGTVRFPGVQPPPGGTVMSNGNAAPPANSTGGSDWRRTGVFRTAGAAPSAGPVVGEPGGFAGPAPAMTGVFDTDFGVLTLTQRDGSYTYQNGRVSIARVYGDFMDGAWVQSQSSQRCNDGTYRGRFHFRFTRDGFTGSYGICDGPITAGQWNGRRR